MFSNNNKIIPHPPVFFNNEIVTSAPEHTHLGLELDSKFSFSKHTAAKIQTARKGIGVIRFLSSFVPVKTLGQLYKLFVRLHLDYADTIYHIPHLNLLMNSIERTQYQGALAASGTWTGTNTSKLYDELGWESLSDRWFHRLI